MYNNCGVFDVKFPSTEASTEFDCVKVLSLTVGGTAVPLLIVIVCLLCLLCFMCRKFRKRTGSLRISKVEENNSEIATVRIGDNHHPVEVQLKEIGYAGDEDPTDLLYDSIVEVKKVPITTVVKDVAPPNMESTAPQQYEEFRSKDDKLPLYATPDRNLKMAKDSSADKRISMPSMLDQHSSPFEDKNNSDANRYSLNLLSDGMALYSSIADITAPPLPPPLATEDIDPLGTRAPEQNTETMQQNKEKVGSIDETDDRDLPFYSNVTLKQREAEEVVEIQQELYVNIK